MTKMMKIDGKLPMEIPTAVVGNCDDCNDDNKIFYFVDYDNDGCVYYECNCGVTWPLTFQMIDEK